MKAALASVAALFVAGVSAGMNEDGMFLKALKEKQWRESEEFSSFTRATFKSTQNAAAKCNEATNQVFVQGTAFPCKNIDFEGYVSIDDMKTSSKTNACSDIWGWLDGSGREISIICVNNGVWFVDGTNPASPLILASLPAKSDKGSSWCDIKVYKDVAYIVKDAATPDNGIQVFDLHRLDAIKGFAPGVAGYPTFVEDFWYTEHGDSHNIAVDTESGFLYSVGSNTCSGGLHVIDLSIPLKPKFSTCVSSDGYTHDVQCVVYTGPDTRYTGKQICFAFNEDTLTIWDVSDKTKVKLISREKYLGVAYSHQGWLTEDMSYLLLDDELDETKSTDKRTKTMIVNIEDLTDPIFESRIVHPEFSIDHNLYFWGAIHKRGWGGNPALAKAPLPQYAYLSNYASGLRVVEIDTSVVPIVPKEAGYFDVSPEYATAEFHGTWSNYMHPSGIVAISSIERGLFLVRPKMAFATVTATPMNTEQFAALLLPEDSSASSATGKDLTGTVVGLALVAFVAIVALPVVAYVYKNKGREEANTALSVAAPKGVDGTKNPMIEL